MGDHFDDEAFDTTNAPGSLTFPMQASALRKGGHVLLKGNPCKIVDMSTSKTGKHGHAKVHFVGLDIFTGKKCEDICPSTHNMDVPNIKREDWQLLDVTHDGFLSLLDSTGSNQKDDLKIPEDEMGDRIRTAVEDGTGLLITVQSAMGKECVAAVKNLDA